MQKKLIAILVVQLWFGSTRPLWAQSSIASYLGFNRGGVSACVTPQTCDDKTVNLGSSIGPTNGLRGLDDFGAPRDLFGRTDDGSRVFVLSTIGLITRVTPHITALLEPDTNSLRFWRGKFRVVVTF